MKKILIGLVFTQMILYSCIKKEYNAPLSEKYLHKVFLNGELINKYQYEDKKVISVSYYRENQNFRNDFIKYNEYGKISKVEHLYTNNQYKDFVTEYTYDNEGRLIFVGDTIWGNKNFNLEYDEQGRLETALCFKSLPDSVYYYLIYEYESNNISEIEWYGGDGNYTGNLTFTYDTKNNPFKILRDVYSYGHVIYQYQDNNILITESDVSKEDGYAYFEFNSSFYPSNFGAVLIPLENDVADIKYFYDLDNYLKYRILKPNDHPSKIYIWRYDYIKL